MHHQAAKTPQKNVAKISESTSEKTRSKSFSPLTKLSCSARLVPAQLEIGTDGADVIGMMFGFQVGGRDKREDQEFEQLDKQQSSSKSLLDLASSQFNMASNP